MRTLDSTLNSNLPSDCRQYVTVILLLTFCHLYEVQIGTVWDGTYVVPVVIKTALELRVQCICANTAASVFNPLYFQIGWGGVEGRCCFYTQAAVFAVGLFLAVFSTPSY